MHPTDEKLLRFFSDAEETFVDVEREITVPVVRRKGFQPFVAAARQVLILPYDRSTERLLSHGDLPQRFPLAWTYLKRHKKELSAREKGRFADCWWCLSRAQNIKKWLGEKVLVPYMIDRLQAIWDDEGRFFVNVTTGGYGLRMRPEVAAALGEEGHYYAVGLLNSKLLDYVMRRLSNHFHGGYYPANKQYLQHLPIKLPETSEEKKLAERITASVRAIMDAKTKLNRGGSLVAGVRGGLEPAGLSDRQTKSLKGQVEAHERRIDEAVFALYGVDGLPDG